MLTFGSYGGYVCPSQNILPPFFLTGALRLILYLLFENYCHTCLTNSLILNFIFFSVNSEYFVDYNRYSSGSLPGSVRYHLLQYR